MGCERSEHISRASRIFYAVRDSGKNEGERRAAAKECGFRHLAERKIIQI